MSRRARADRERPAVGTEAVHRPTGVDRRPFAAASPLGSDPAADASGRPDDGAATGPHRGVIGTHG